jgi:peptide/nickel transport system substrate-binding protein
MTAVRTGWRVRGASTAARRVVGALLPGVLGVLAAAGAAGPAAAAPQGTVTFAIPSEPATVDPAIEVAGPGYRVLLQLYDGLLEYRGTTTELAPALAQSWTVAPDGTAIDLRLRPDVRFHDGSALDAETVKASIDRTKAVNRGGAFFLQALKEVQVVDRLTVRLVATQPSVSLLYGLPKVFITGKAHLADPDRGAAFFATRANGTGPYRLTRWDKGQQLVLDHVPDHWRGWPGSHVAQVIQRVVPAAGTQQLLLERGDAHLVVLPSIGITQDPKELAAKPGVKMVESPAFRVTVISMNTQKGPLRDVRLRRALQAAFDYEGMVQVYKGYAEVPNSPIPKGFTAAWEAGLPPFKRDVALAKRLMAEAGLQGKPLALSFVYTETEPQARLAGLLLQQAVQELGITVNLEGKPFATLAAQIANLETAPDIQATLTMTPRSADPGELLRTLYLGSNAGKSFNYSWYASPAVDRLLAEADRTFDEPRRMAMYREVARKLIEDAPSIWAAYPRLIEVMREEVQGYTYSPLNYSGIFPFYPIGLRR